MFFENLDTIYQTYSSPNLFRRFLMRQLNENAMDDKKCHNNQRKAVTYIHGLTTKDHRSKIPEVANVS